LPNCDDGSDETGCGTPWDEPAILITEACNEPFVPDLQFRCAEDANTCIHIEARCNGVNNCPIVGGSESSSDEEGCSGLSGVSIEPTTGFTATILDSITTQSHVFHDRDYQFTSLGSFATAGYSYVKISHEDKHTQQSKVQLKLRLPRPLTIYINRMSQNSLPWLASEGWTRSASMQGVSYSGSYTTAHKEWARHNVENYQVEIDRYPQIAEAEVSEVWQKTFPAGTVELRGDDGGQGAYLIFFSTPGHNAPVLGGLPSPKDLFR
jgi:hypothetical protein